MTDIEALVSALEIAAASYITTMEDAPSRDALDMAAAGRKACRAALDAAIAELVKERDGMREALVRYAEHDDDCCKIRARAERVPFSEAKRVEHLERLKTCTCGLKAALAASGGRKGRQVQMSEPRLFNANGRMLTPHEGRLKALYVHIEDYDALRAELARVKEAGEAMHAAITEGAIAEDLSLDQCHRDARWLSAARWREATGKGEASANEC